ncbi:hypothetical protein KDM41_14035 [bacterium]|nr:hypothetical protein [bacterium]
MPLSHAARRLSVLLFLLTVTALPRPALAADHPLFPLATGTVRNYTTAGIAKDRYTLVQGPASFGAAAVTAIEEYNYWNIGSRRWTMVDLTPAGDLMLHGWRTFGTDGSVYDQILTPPVRLLPAAPTGGMSWSDATTIDRYLDGELQPGSEGYTYSVTVTGDAEPVTVRAGTFEAVVVASDWGTGVRTSWYAPGVGLVRDLDVNGTDLQLWDMSVATDRTSWGGLKALFR